MIEFIFNGINLIARIGVVIYIVRKYVVRAVSDAIFYQQESIKILENKYQDIKAKSHEIEKNIHDQEQLYFDLQKKFITWQNCINSEQEKFEKDCFEREKIAKLLFEKKQKNLERKTIFQKELPAVLDQVQHDIQIELQKDQKLGKDYIQNIMTHLSQE